MQGNRHGLVVCHRVPPLRFHCAKQEPRSWQSNTYRDHIIVRAALGPSGRPFCRSPRSRDHEVMRVRRRLALSGVLALAIALIGGGPLAHDPRIRELVTGDKPRLGVDPVDARSMALAPIGSGRPPTAKPPRSRPSSRPRRRPRRTPRSGHQGCPSSDSRGRRPRRCAPPRAISCDARRRRRAPRSRYVGRGHRRQRLPGQCRRSELRRQRRQRHGPGARELRASSAITCSCCATARSRARTLLDSVSWLANHAGPDSVAGFFYAGHVRKTSGGNEEIVTSDGSSVIDSQLASALSRVAANRSWVAIAGLLRRWLHRGAAPGPGAHGAAGAQPLAYENAAHRSQLHGRVHGPSGDDPEPGRRPRCRRRFNYAVDRISQEKPGPRARAVRLRRRCARPAPAESQPQRPARRTPSLAHAPTTTTQPAKDRPGSEPEVHRQWSVPHVHQRLNARRSVRGRRPELSRATTRMTTAHGTVR